MQINVHSSRKKKNERESQSANSSLAVPTRPDGNKMRLSCAQIAWWMAVVGIAPDELFAEEKRVNP